MAASSKRSYNADLPGGTATTTIQIQAGQTLKNAMVTWVNAAAGKIELSLSASSQIGTAQPTTDVVFRLSASAGLNTAVCDMPISLPVKAFQSLYVHQTGAGNLGNIVLS